MSKDIGKIRKIELFSAILKSFILLLNLIFVENNFNKTQFDADNAK
jgi:hypothetical protein